jgi:porin
MSARAGKKSATVFFLSHCALLIFAAANLHADAGATQPTQPSEAPPTTAQAPGFSGMLTGDWLGERQKLSDDGISFAATLLLEGFDNFQGGVDTAHPVGSTTFDLNATLDLHKMLNLSGAEIYCDLEDHAFRNPTTALVGDAQVFDKSVADPYLQIFEFWYQQTLLSGKLRIKLGKVDANTEFAVIDNAEQCLSSSAALSPTIFLMPTTPDPMPGVNAFLTPTDWFFFIAGAYYSNRSNRFLDLVGDPAAAQLARYGTFLITETGFRWNSTPLFAYPGNLKLGFWGHTGTFHRFDGSTQSGTEGGYAIANQTLYQPKNEPPTGRGLRTFLEYGGTESSIDLIDEHVGGGFTLTGPFQTRDLDIVGITAQYAQISRRAKTPYPFELAIEAFCQIQLTPWLQFQPDLQFIIHPSGLHPDALVATLRATIQF